MFAFAQPKFPTELILQFLCHSDPRDIIRWRAVSKKFDAIIHDVALWRALYKSAPFPLPSGPFATQSSESLQRTLVKATRLAESWTAQPIRVLSSICVDTVDPEHLRYSAVKFVFGRWVIVHQNQQFVLHDVDLGTKRCTSQILWEGGPRVTGWDARPMVSPEGQFMVYILVQFILSLRSPNWKLLKFRLDYNSGALCDSVVFDPPDDRNNEHTPCLQAGNSRFIFIPTNQEQLVFDTRTDMFYAIPLLIPVRNPCSLLDWVVFTDTYLLFLSHNPHSTNVHIFTLPPNTPVHQGLLILHHTHTHIIYNPFQEVKFMKPTVNLTTGETNIRFFNHQAQRAGLELEYVEVTIPKRSIGTVLPLKDKVGYISLPKERVWLSRYVEHYQYIDISDDGHIRGFFRGLKRSGRPMPWEFDGIQYQHIMKFAIDTTQNPWAIACSRIAPSEWDNWSRGYDTGGKNVQFDALRGTLCYFQHSSGRICVEEFE